MIREFCEENECYIRETAINNFAHGGSDAEKYYYTMRMLRDHRNDLNGVSIHPGFPGELLMETFSSYLPEYLRETFSLNPGRKYRARIKLQKRLARFGKLNPTFGRKVIELPSSSVDDEYPEYRTAYVDTVTLNSPRITPRGQARRRARVLNEGSTNSTPEISGRNGNQVIEIEPAPNEEESVQRAEAGAYRAARELERVEEAMNDVVGMAVDTTDRTLQRLENLRNRITEATRAVEELQDGEDTDVHHETDAEQTPPLVGAAISAVEEAVSHQDEDSELTASLRRRPLPVLPTANLRAIMARYRAARPQHPTSPEVDSSALSPPLVPPPIDETSPPEEQSDGDEEINYNTSEVPLEEDI